MKCEAEIWAEERDRIAARASRPTLAERIAAAWRKPAHPEPDVYAWRDVGELFEDR